MESPGVSACGRFLCQGDGSPFFLLGDTAWTLFQRLKRGEVEHYFKVRKKQGFNTVLAVVLSEMDGLRVPNANGHLPLLGEDPARPNEYYFRFVDEVVRMAAETGLYIGLLPTWGDKVDGTRWGIGPQIFNAGNARVYGQFLGRRYRGDGNIIWVMGGDRPAAGFEGIWNAMAEGIAEGLGRRGLFTYHPWGGHSSSAWLHEADWLDMNLLQSGHVRPDEPVWDMVSRDYDRLPVKPVLDGEPNYEDHPINPFARKWQPDFGRFTDYDVRKQAYRSVFSGACGHVYGHHSVWQFLGPDREPVNFPMPAWEEAVLRPGASQLVHLKELILSRPYASRIPDQGMLVDLPPAPAEGDGAALAVWRAGHPCATRCARGAYGLVYVPLAGQAVRVDLGRLSGRVRASWFDPRNGKTFPAGEHANGVVEFVSPVAGPDWVLVLDGV